MHRFLCWLGFHIPGREVTVGQLRYGGHVYLCLSCGREFHSYKEPHVVESTQVEDN